MKRLIKVLCIFLFFTFLGFAQESEPRDSLQIKVKQAARDIMTSANTCALITIDGDGAPRVRMMDPFAPEEDFTVWFGTNPRSRKVAQIEKNSKVTLYYTVTDGAGYVTLHGKAQVINDPSQKEKHWKEEWKAFYKNNSSDYLLIKVTPLWMEVVSYSHGIVSTASNWQPPVVFFDSH